jgi:hypothetical protein
MNHNVETDPPDTYIEQLEQLEALLLLMLSPAMEMLAPASRKSIFTLALSIVTPMLEAAASRKSSS